MNPLATPDAAELLTVAASALVRRCSAPPTRRRIAEGQIPAVQLGAPGSAVRVPRAALTAWLWSEPNEQIERSPFEGRDPCGKAFLTRWGATRGTERGGPMPPMPR